MDFISSQNPKTFVRKNSCKFRCHNSNQNISNSPKHWFVIISDKNDQEFVTALPFTSTSSQELRNNGVQITVDDVTTFSKSQNRFNPDKLTLALCNKVCRISKEGLKEHNDYGMIKKPKYNDLVWEVKTIIKDAN